MRPKSSLRSTTVGTVLATSNVRLLKARICLRTCSVFMIWECSVALRRIFQLTSRDVASSARTVMAASATAPATRRARFMRNLSCYGLRVTRYEYEIHGDDR